MSSTPQPDPSTPDVETAATDLSDDELAAASGGGTPLAGSGFEDVSVGAVIF